ncbi:Histone deacetylase superfamily [Carpediemonas membranifera]|uniref:histone deacetylase n=1 Tax=Carpediemonas membranifera TaxID=201153 RepID=A0A8J6AW76_9EUKA|nr:Histone deacetylase superfamily [Carpediemonas membranifera]|eukprot:KAG9395713.1 Histone deacetylase superfamily [Carpediemonas membranifera]
MQERKSDFWCVVSKRIVESSSSEALTFIHTDASRLTYSLLRALHVNRVKLNTFYEPLIANFHTEEYIRALKEEKPCTFFREDSQPFPGIYEYARLIVDGTCTAADMLIDGVDMGYPAPVTLFWQGGRHHAHADLAHGYCWLNDVVIGINRLQERFPRVLYVDTDFHHGDGVQAAFYNDPTVTTVSFHAFGDVFPFSGSETERGEGPGLGHCINVPIPSTVRLSDREFELLSMPVLEYAFEIANPDVVVYTVGADTVLGDPLTRGYNTTTRAICNVVQYLLSRGKPLLLLGGGGYEPTSVAKMAGAVAETVSLGMVPDNDATLPVTDRNLDKYRPHVQLHTQRVYDDGEGYRNKRVKKVEEILRQTLPEKARKM